MTNSVLQRAKVEGSILRTVKGRKINWIGQSLRRDRHLKRVIEGKVGNDRVTGRRGRRHKQLLDVPKEKRGY